MGQGLYLMRFRGNTCLQEGLGLCGDPDFRVVWAEAWERASEMAFANCTYTLPDSDKKPPTTYQSDSKYLCVNYFKRCK